jgi:signal transduction histidine kinase
MKIDRSFDLIGQMRTLESIVSSGGPLRRVDLREALERTSSEFDIPIDIDCDHKVTADDALYSVVENLIRNAINHGGTEKMMFRSILEENGFVNLQVIDFGKGIADDIKDHIFDENFKHGKNAGTGLGLFIVKRTLERYGGSISVKDNEEGGSIFELRIPPA